LPRKETKVSASLLLFIAATAAYAGPTINSGDRYYVDRSPLPGRCEHISCCSALQISQTDKIYNSHLSNIAAEFLKPPVAIMDSQAKYIHAKSLPSVPGALFMALVGFLCISLVKDRKVWLAILASLLWASQAGFTALPQLASHLASKRHIKQQACPKLIHSELEDSDRQRSDIEGTQYIGLLYHLEGIPCKEEPHVKRGAKYLAPPFRRGLPQYATRTTHYESPQFAIIGQLSHLSQVIICLAYEFRQFFCFSPAFIFESLPRGPPQISL